MIESIMILGIDPGLANTGWAILENCVNGEPKLVDWGVLLTKNSESHEKRIERIYEGICRLIIKYKINELALEKLFFAKNSSSAIEVAEAIGVIRLAAQKNDAKVYSYTPLEVKMALVGYGRAEKNQVEEMVRNVLGIEGVIKPSHAADAIAIGLTQIFTLRIGQ